MKENTPGMEVLEKRSESRAKEEQYYSVEFSIKGVESTYQFRIWNVSSRGMCVLLKEDSAILSYLKVGDIIDMKYYQADSLRPSEYLKTKIMHITKDDTGRFKDSYLLGLAICS